MHLWVEMLQSNLHRLKTLLELLNAWLVTFQQLSLDKYMVGFVESPTLQCTLKTIFMDCIILIVWGVIVIRLLMAIFFQLINSRQLTRKKTAYSKTVVKSKDLVVALVTCYSESEKGIKATLDSIANAEHPDKEKSDRKKSITMS